MRETSDFYLLEQLKTNNELYYLALILLSNIDRRNSAIIPELSLILDEDNLLRFLDFYGGQTIKIPTRKELSTYLKAMMVYYFKDIKGLSLTEATKKAKVSFSDRNLSWNYNNFKEILSTIKVPEMDDLFD